MAITNKILDAAVERFHERVASDPELAGFFEGMDMRRILLRQMALLTLVAGGPVPYAGPVSCPR